MEKRDPSIHITKVIFDDILSELNITNFPATRFFQLAKRRAVNTRSITVSNKKLQKQVNKVTLADIGDANLIADIIYSERIKLKHKGIRKINESQGREWDACKKLAGICNTFCQDFDLEIRAGYIKYVEIGIKRMNGNYKNFASRLVQMSENISQQYECELELANDETPWLTDQAFTYYVSKIAKVTGIYDNNKDPLNLVHFKALVKVAGQDKIKDWIDAQFYALAFCNGIPAPKDLVGEKALERYNKYLYKMKHREELPPEEDLNLWDKINNNDDDLPF